MDKLNKLRMLAGVAVKYTPSPKKSLMEAAPQPVVRQPLTRADLANKAAMHLNQAIKALNELDGTTLRNYADKANVQQNQIQDKIEASRDLHGHPQVGKKTMKKLNNRTVGRDRALTKLDPNRPRVYEAATQSLVEVLNTILENLGQGFEIDPPAEDDEHIQDPSEFAELSADADASAYGELGGEEDLTSPEVVAKIAAYAKEAGLGDEQATGDELDSVEQDLVGDERQLDDLGSEDDEFADDELDGPTEPLPGEDPGAVGEMEPGYGEDDGEFSEFDEAAPAITDKNESPNQLDHLEPSPTDDHDRKVSVPASVKTALRTQAAQARKEAKELGVADKDAKWFYENLAKMFEELLGHLDGGTVLDIKKAQIFMSSLMGPMLHKIPAEVVSFVAKGGAERTLKDYMKPVDKKYPVTGKLYKGE